MKKLFYTAGIFIALNSACSESQTPSAVIFANPQPEDGMVLRKFPISLLGEYISDKDSNSLVIQPEGIFRYVHYKKNAHVNQLDSGDVLIGDSVIRDTEWNLNFPVKRVGDTVYFELNTVDTLFLLSADHMLRKSRDTYILNRRQEKGWKVVKLEKKNKQLIWASVSENEADHLKKLSDNYIDSVPYEFHLSASKFREFLKADGFQDTDTFKAKSRRKKAYNRINK
ncbi:hypothetical protein [Daejeonella lutea]|uniref:Uncharacterized protein n=1 Tax=Daejeonella lutea TaxID=572036 RepID=A0A1T5AN33_9SPHI|nr:hypothetical protein [Daejeonella lutea]SKB36240.1 hypothetical protein SAMN05661099_0879 [Daejeonella lutea]